MGTDQPSEHPPTGLLLEQDDQMQQNIRVVLAAVEVAKLIKQYEPTLRKRILTVASQIESIHQNGGFIVEQRRGRDPRD